MSVTRIDKDEQRLFHQDVCTVHSSKPHPRNSYVDCTKAVIATDGILLADAKEVADKLKVEILNIDSSVPLTTKKPKSHLLPNMLRRRTC